MVLNINIFKRLQLKKAYYDSLYYYNLISDKFSDSKWYQHLNSALKEKQSVSSQQLISPFKSLKSPQFTYSEIIKKLGKPKFRIKTNKDLNIEILFYRIHFSGQKVKILFHLNNNQLFLSSFIYSYLNDDYKKQMIQRIENQYIKGASLRPDENFIIDSNNVILTIEDSIDFTVHYINDRNNEAIRNIKRQLNFLPDTRINYSMVSNCV